MSYTWDSQQSDPRPLLCSLSQIGTANIINLNHLSYPYMYLSMLHLLEITELRAASELVCFHGVCEDLLGLSTYVLGVS